MNQSKTSMNNHEGEANGPGKGNGVQQPTFIQQQKQNGIQSGIGSKGNGRHSLQNPMIIDRKFNLNAASRQSFNISMQNSSQGSHRYHLKDGHQTHLQSNNSQSNLVNCQNLVRKSSHNNATSLGQNKFYKRLG